MVLGLFLVHGRGAAVAFVPCVEPRLVALILALVVAPCHHRFRQIVLIDPGAGKIVRVLVILAVAPLLLHLGHGVAEVQGHGLYAGVFNFPRHIVIGGIGGIALGCQRQVDHGFRKRNIAFRHAHEFHGLLAGKFGYEVGLFNGTGASVNTAGKTLSDDWHIPSLLYAGRLTYMPKGVMPSTQGNPNRLHEDKIMFGLSASVNVESESESTNDTRVGLEFAWLKNRLYLAAEAYWMNVGFTKRQKIDKSYNFLGGYVQGGYFVAPRVQLAARYDFFNRNGVDTNGFLNMPAVGVNYFFKGCNLKLQAMYQFIGRTGHDTQLDRDNDDLGIATHSATVLLQYSF